jgi:hypothetical protein
MSTRETLRRLRPKVTTVETAEGPVFVRAMSGVGRMEYFRLVREAGDGGMAPMHEIAALGLCDQDGTLVFDVENPADLAELAAFDGDVLQRICMALLDTSGMSARAQEDAEKKSDASPS